MITLHPAYYALLVVILLWLAIKYYRLEKNLIRAVKRSYDLNNAFASIVDRVEGYNNNKNHAKEVTELALKIAQKTSMASSNEQLLSLEMAAKFHDIGMLMVMNDAMKCGQDLKGDHAFSMKNHPLLAEHFLKQELGFDDDIPSIIRWHHERWDGFGYPDNLRGIQIPLPSRILAIADAVSAMRSQRNYRKTNYKNNEIINELKRQSGLQFDPYLINITVALLEKEELY